MAGKTTFRRDKDGNLVAYRDGKKVGDIGGMGDAKPKKSTKRKKA